MKPLQSIQKMLTWLSICRFDVAVDVADETKRKWIKFMYVAFSFAIIATEINAFCSGAVFFLKNVSSDLNAALFALLLMVGYSGTIYTFIVALVIRHKIHDTIKSLTTIYDTSKNSLKFSIYSNRK